MSQSKSTSQSFHNFDELPNTAFVRVSTVARLLDCSVVSVWRMIKDGRLPPTVKISPRITGLNVGEIRKILKIK